MWEFETDEEFQEELDWVERLVRDEIELVDQVVSNPFDLQDPVRKALIPPLQQRVMKRGLWAAHLGPELDGPGYGQLKLALINEHLGRSRCAPIVFGSQAPDSGNMEILAHFGTPQQKARYLEPLLRGDVVSCFSMTEPQGGADPKVFRTRAVHRDGTWVLNGEKWFSSNARYAEFLIVMAVTDPDGPPYQSMSMFVVPSASPGVEIVRNVSFGGEPEGEGDHAYIRYTDVMIPDSDLLGEPGQGFLIAQTRLGGGRVHHAMRTVGAMKKAFELLCERAVSRSTQGELLAEKQLVRQDIAECWTTIEQFRLLVLQTAWKIDKYNDYKMVRGDISAVKALMPKVYEDVVVKTMHVFGALGMSDEMPFANMLMEALALGVADGPTEVHQMTLARELLRDIEPADELFSSGHVLHIREEARAKYADLLSEAAGSY